MVFHEETESYVPVLYALMSHKNTKLYREVFSAFNVCSQWKMNVRTYTSDFEIALFSEMDEAFGPRYAGGGGGVHVGCLFHLKQAWRKFLVEKCKFFAHEIEDAMAIGGLDTLTIIPRDEIVTYGIPFLRSVLDGTSATKWDVFWKYFAKQWLNKIPSWNILDENGEYLEVRNRTNNAIESYNHRFNNLFERKPSLLVFVQTLEKESRDQAEWIQDIRTGKIRPNTYHDVTMPPVRPDYAIFKANAEKQAAAAARKRAKKGGS